MEGIPGRRSARLSRGTRGTGLGGLWIDARLSLKRGARRSRKRRRQGCQRRSDTDLARRKTTPPSKHRPAAEVGVPRVKRGLSPASFVSGGPELPDARGARLRTSDALRGGDDREYEHGAARLRNVDDPRYSAERLLARRVIALGRDEVRVLDLERFRSANVDRTHHRSRRPRELARANLRIRAA